MSGVVVIATGDNWPDAIATGAFTARWDTPAGSAHLLLTFQNRITRVTTDQIKAVNPDRVVIVGGTTAVSADIEAQVKALVPGAIVERIAGVDREDTAVRLDKWKPTTTPPGPVGITINPGDNWQAKFDGAGTAQTFVVKTGTHSPDSPRPKNGSIIIGEVGAVLDGKTTLWGCINPNADNVTMKNLEVTHYASQLQWAPLDGQLASRTSSSGKNWVLEDINSHHNKYAGLGVGDGWIARNCSVHHNGQIGVKGSFSKGAQWLGGEWHNNHKNPGVPSWNWNPADWGGSLAETGGSKFAESLGCLVRGVHVYDNDGPGIWYDINNKNYEVDACLVERNIGAQVFFEISFEGKAHDCTIVGTGDTSVWLWDAAVQIAASQGVEVWNMNISKCRNGLAILQQGDGSNDPTHGRGQGRDPETGAPRWWRCDKNYLHDNDVADSHGSGVVTDNKDVAIYDVAKSKFERNHYKGNSNAWGWANGWTNWAGWQAAKQDLAGSYAP